LATVALGEAGKPDCSHERYGAMKKVRIIGAGMDPWNMPEGFNDLIYGADILVAGGRFLALFQDFKGEAIPVKGDLDKVFKRIEEEADRDREVVVLADGDPLFFGIGRRLMDFLGKDRVEFHPNVTTLQVAASLLKIPWEDIRTVSLHGRKDIRPLLRALAFSDRVGVYTGDAQGPALVARVLRDRGIETFAMTVLEDLCREGQKVREVSLEEAEKLQFSHLNFLLLRRVRQPEIPLGLGIEDDSYVHERGMITKREIRVVALALMRVRPGNTVWDLGAGCGSVAIEASCFSREGRVYAVEKDRERAQQIGENIRRTGAYGVEVVEGTMPGCLVSLPDPDRVFLGGGLRHGQEILEPVAERLRPGGRMVVNAVLMGSLWQVKGYLETLKWPFGITQVHVARSRETSGDLRLEGLNPVFVLSAQKPKD